LTYQKYENNKYNINEIQKKQSFFIAEMYKQYFMENLVMIIIFIPTMSFVTTFALKRNIKYYFCI